MTSPSRRGRERGLAWTIERIADRIATRARAAEAAALAPADRAPTDPLVARWCPDGTVVIWQAESRCWRRWAAAEVPAAIAERLLPASQARLARQEGENPIPRRTP